LDCGTLLAQLAQRREHGEVPSTEFADHVEPMSPRGLRAAWKQFQGRLDAGGGGGSGSGGGGSGSGSGGSGGGAALGFEAFGALISQLVAAQGRPPLSTLEQLGLFAKCDLDGSQDIDFNEWCGALPQLAAIFARKKTAARSRWGIAALAAVKSGGGGGGGKELVGDGEAGAAAALRLKLTVAAAVRTGT